MCKTAYEASDYKSTVEYADKVLEIDQNCEKAWEYRALACGWESTLKDNKANQIITAAKRAVALLPIEEKMDVATSIYDEANKIIMILINKTVGMGGGISTTAIKQASHHSTFTAWIRLVTEIPFLPEELMRTAIEECKKLDTSNKLRLTDLKAAISSYNNKVPYHETMKQLVDAKILKENREKELRIEEYWNNHQAEKQQLESKRQNLEKQIEDIDNQIDQLPSSAVISDITNEINLLNDEIKNLGMFKGKEKKALNNRIDKLKVQLDAEEKKMEKSVKPYMESKEKIHSEIDQIIIELEKDRD